MEKIKQHFTGIPNDSNKVLEQDLDVCEEHALVLNRGK